jgi:hypothetical protein
MKLVHPGALALRLFLTALPGCTSAAIVGESSDAATDLGGGADDVSIDAPAQADAVEARDARTIDATEAADAQTVDAVDAPNTDSTDAPTVDAPDGCARTGAEVCDGVDNDCDGAVDEGFCRIDGACFTQGQLNPANRCLACVIASSTRSGPTAWSDVAAGAVCRASVGACDPAETCAGDGSPCPADRLAPGGPTSYTRGVSPIAYVDACAAAGSRRALVSADQDYVAVGLPFSFRFSGAASPIAVIAVNGMVSFSSAAATAAGPNAMLPHAAIPSTIFALWDDLETSAAGVCLATVGAAPNRRYVVEWRDARFCCGSVPESHLDFEVVLSEGSDVIDVLYRRLDGPADRATGGSATVGLQGSDATAFDLAAFDLTGALRGGGSFRWTPRGPTVCRPSAGPCDPAEVCTGASALCPGDALTPSTTMCRPGASACDPIERCTGANPSCPADAFAAAGTSCGAGRVCAGAACCATGATPSPETCNNVDDDCDGVVDNGVTRDCYAGPAGTAGVGACRLGMQTCAAGVWGACAGEVTPSVETCDHLDRNCNGVDGDGVTCP